MSVAPAQTQRFMRHESWSNALFVHWAVDAAALSALLPPQLEGPLPVVLPLHLILMLLNLLLRLWVLQVQHMV